MKFHVNPPIWSRDPCGRTDGPTGRDMKLIVASINFANAPKNTHVYVLFLSFSPLFPHPYFCCLLTISGASPSTP